MSARRLQCLLDETEEGGLPLAVAADDGGPPGSIDGEREMLEHLCIGVVVVEADIVEDDG